MNRFAKTVNYKIWLGLNWLEQVIFPSAHRLSVTVRRQVLLAVLMVTVGLPINVYIFSGATERTAVAADEHIVSTPALLSEMDAAGSEGHGDSSIMEADAPQQSALEHAQNHSDPNYV